MVLSCVRSGVFALFISVAALFASPAKAATVLAEVAFDVPILPEIIWTIRYCQFRALYGVLHIDLFGTAAPELSLWQGRRVTSTCTDINLYVRASANFSITFNLRRSNLLREANTQAGHFRINTTQIVLSKRILHVRCFSATCIPERAVFDGGAWLRLTPLPASEWALFAGIGALIA